MPALTEAPPTHLPGGYRPHLDGLRAVAVLAVLFYHYRVPGFGGGYVGVDIFFVISGYLISRILIAEVEGGRFSILAFYERRVRRLAPALLLMAACVSVAGWWLLMPRDFDRYGQSLATMMAGLSNFYFWLVGFGYFRPVTDTMPLLHSWSLAVEEQFYLVFPLFLAFFLRRGRRWAAAALGLAFTASLLLAAWMARVQPDTAFFFPVTRGWELLLGALLALRLERPAAEPRAPSPRVAAAAGLAGLALMAFAITRFTAATPMPGPWALIPCGGAALLIWSGASGANPATRLLALPPLVWTGLVSYGLFLWHWPIWVLLRHHGLQAPLGPVWTLAAAALAFAAAALSFHLVELPIRRKRVLAGRRRLFIAAGAGAAALFGAAMLIAKSDGVPARVPGFAAYRQPDANDRPPLVCGALALARDPACRAAGAPAGRRRALLWGDSFALHYAAALSGMKDRLPFDIAFEASSHCARRLDDDLRGIPSCRSSGEPVLALAERAGIDTLILSIRWEAYRRRLDMEALEASLRRLRARGFTVILFGQSPVFSFEYPDSHHYRRMLRGAPADQGSADNLTPPELNARLQLAARRAGAMFFDPGEALCDGNSCRYRANDRYLVHSTSHLTREGAQVVLEHFLQSPEFGAEAGMWRERPPRRE